MRSVLDIEPSRLKGSRFGFDTLTEVGGRVEWWGGEPDPSAMYVAGADFAYGIQGRDYDTLAIYRIGEEPVTQVLECQGHWGPRFDRLLYAALMLYNEAFLVGERQVGLFALSNLVHEFGYRNLYGDRDETTPGRKSLKRLGYHKGAGDIVVPKFRKAVFEGSVMVRSLATRQQMSMLQFRPRSSIDLESALDEDMKIKLAEGGSPDLVMASAYAFHAVGEVRWIDKPTPIFRENTYGAILGTPETLEEEERQEREERGFRRPRR